MGSRGNLACLRYPSVSPLRALDIKASHSNALVIQQKKLRFVVLGVLAIGESSNNTVYKSYFN